MVSLDVLKGPRLKVKRAYRHIEEIMSRTDPLDSSLYEITFDKKSMFPDDNTPGLYIHYRPVQPIPETIALVIGDAVHNLRAALDHLVTGIVRTVQPGARQHFPIHPKRENLVTAPVLALIEEALPNATRLLLEEVRPENGPNEALWRFNDLDNDDKHNLVLPTVTVIAVNNLNITNRNNGGVLRDCAVGGDANGPIGIYGAPNFTGTVHNKPTVAVSVRFGQGSPFQNEPVIPTLTKIAGLVSHTLDKFERLILQTA